MTRDAELDAFFRAPLLALQNWRDPREALAGDLAAAFLAEALPPLSWPALSEKPSILVAGASGSLGAACVRRLLELGLDPVLLSRPGSAAPFDDKLRRIFANPAEGPCALLRAFDRSGFVPEAILCCQGSTGATGRLRSFFEANVLASRGLALAASACGSRLASAGTLSVFVAASELPELCLESDRRLDSNLRLRGAYAATKWIDERQLADAGAAVVRLGLLVPEIPKPGEFLDTVLRSLIRVGAAPAVGEPAAFDCTPLHSAAEFMIRTLLAEAAPGIVHCAGESPVSADALLARVAARVHIETLPWERFEARSDERLGTLERTLLRRMFRRDGVRGDGRDFNFDLFQSTGTAFECRKGALFGAERPSRESASDLLGRRVERILSETKCP